MRVMKTILAITICILSISVGWAQEKVNGGLRALLASGEDPRMSRIFISPPAPEKQYQFPFYQITPPTEPRRYIFAEGGAVVFPNIPLRPNPTTAQSEMSVTYHPLNADIVFVGANTLNLPSEIRSQGWYYTTNGGQTWTGSDTLPTHTNYNLFMADPAVGMDVDGTLFLNAILYNRLDTGDVIVTRSTNQGLTWAQAVIPNPSVHEDKNHMVIDRNPNSPYSNYIYTAFTDFEEHVFTSPIKFSRSTNKGATFSPPIQISDYIGLLFAQGVNLAVGPAGELYAVWSGYDTWPPPLTTRLGFNKSTDGGQTWTGGRAIQNVRDIRGMMRKGNDSIRVNSFPSMAVDFHNGFSRGWIYVVYAERTGYGSDIRLIRSTDNGETWSSPVKVNQDYSTNDQWFPWVTVDPITGVLYVVYYDSRRFPRNDSAEVYLSYSIDGGTSFNDIRVSDVAFLPKPIPGTGAGYMGDYIGITAYNNIVLPVWNDDRSGIHQAYTARMQFEFNPQPIISLYPDTLNFGKLPVGTNKTLRLGIQNYSQMGTLNVESIQSNHPSFVPSTASISVPPNSYRTIGVTFYANEPATYEAILMLTSNDPVRPTVTVPLRAKAVLPPSIAIMPDSFSLTVYEGDTVSRTLSISNEGFDDLEYSIWTDYNHSTVRNNQPRILTVMEHGTSSFLLDSLGFSYTVVNNAQFDTVDISRYDVFFVGTDAGNYSSLVKRKKDIEDYVKNGGGVVALVRGYSEQGLLWLPGQVRGKEYWWWGVHIENPAHPVMDSLTKEGLSLWFLVNSSLITSYSPHYQVLASAHYVENKPAVLAGEFGTGRVIVSSLYHTPFYGRELENFVMLKSSIQWVSGNLKKWLCSIPKQGSILPQSNQQINIKVNTVDIDGGDFPAQLVVKSNDSTKPEVCIPVHLTVIGGPNVLVSEDTLVFSETFIGYSDTSELFIKNNGSAVLHISAITSSSTDFIVLDEAPITLFQNKTQKIRIVYVPQQVGFQQAFLSIASNDPNPPILIVPMMGVSIHPPSIKVFPTAMEFTVAAESSASSNLQLTNNGLGTLRCSLKANYKPNLPTGNPSALNVLVVDFSSRAKILFDSLGLNYKSISAENFGTEDLNQYQVIFLGGVWHDHALEHINARKNDIKLFLEGGGGIVALYQRTSNAWRWLPDSVHSFLTWGNVVQLAAAPHFITDSLSNSGLSYWYHSYGNVFLYYPQSSQILAFAGHAGNLPLMLASEYGSGRYVVTGMNPEVYSYSYKPEALRMVAKMVSWVSKGTWLYFSQPSGTVVSSETIDINIIARAGDLSGGTYQCDITIQSNDPANPSVVVPTTLTVIGTPRIEVSSDTVHFGEVYVGFTDTVSIPIHNRGTSTLHITDVTTDHSAYTILSELPLMITPRRSRSLVVQFSPQNAEVHQGTITLFHNDTTKGPIPITLLGMGIHPPKITVIPDSFYFSVTAGEHVITTMMLKNDGLGELVYRFSDTLFPPNIITHQQELDTPGNELALMTSTETRGFPYFHTPSSFVDLPVLVRDENDASDLDVTSLNALVFYDTLWLQIHTRDTINLARFRGVISLDIDQNVTTGQHPPRGGRQEQDVGSEFEINIQAAHPRRVTLLKGPMWSFITHLAMLVERNKVTIPVPLNLLDNDDGNINVSGVFWNFLGPSDWIPDSGHGRIGALKIMMHIIPREGRINPSDSQNVGIKMQTIGQYGGLYRHGVTIFSNDLMTPRLKVPFNVKVKGIPYIRLSHSLLNFGEQFIHYPDTLAFYIHNFGTDTLRVNNIYSDHNDFDILGPVSFGIARRDSKQVWIRFSPNDTGYISGIVTIVSDAFNDSTKTLSLVGRGLHPPVIAVSPDSFIFTSIKTDTLEDSLLIANRGLGVLNYSITPRYYAPEFGFSSFTKDARINVFDTIPRILVIFHSWGIVMVLERANIPHTAVNINSASFTSIDFNQYDIIIMGERLPSPDRLNLRKTDFETFLYSGGSIIALSQWPSCWRWVPDSIESSRHITGNLVRLVDTSHPITDSLSDEVLSHWYPSYKGVFLSYSRNFHKLAVARDAADFPVILTGNFGAGRLVLCHIPIEIPYLWGGKQSALTLLRNMIRWSFSGHKLRVAVSSSSGSVSPGDSVMVGIKVTGRQLLSGLYKASIDITSNDPVQPIVQSFIQLFARGFPEITLDPETLQFSTTFIGDTSSQMLTVHNTGRDTLRIWNFSTNNQNFWVRSTTELQIPPSRYHNVEIQYVPSQVGLCEGLLTFSTNVNNNSTRYVVLRGSGVQPPTISIKQDSLFLSAHEGQAIDGAISIENNGQGILTTKYTSRYLRRWTQETVDSTIRILVVGYDLTFIKSILHLHYTSLSSDSFRYVNLAEYDLIIFLEWSYVLIERKQDIETFLERGGGIIVFGSITNWHWFPGSVQTLFFWYCADRCNFVITENHPIVDSLGSKNVTLEYYHSYVFPYFPEHFTVVAKSVEHGYLPVLLAGHIKKGNVVLSGFSWADYLFPFPTRISLFLLENMLYWAYGFITPSGLADTILQNSQATLEFTVKTKNLRPGTYNSIIVVASNDPVNPRIDIPVRVEIMPAPRIEVNVDTLYFRDVYVGRSDTAILVVENKGSQSLQIHQIVIDNPHFVTLDTIPSEILPNQRWTVGIQFAPQNAATQQGTLRILNNDPQDSSLVVHLIGTGVYPPVITVAPDSFKFVLSTNDSAQGTIIIQNAGMGNLYVTMSIIDVSDSTYLRQTSNDIIQQRLPIRIEDRGYQFDTLWFGIHSSATYGIDESLGENELPPIPPGGAFDVRFLDIPGRTPVHGNGVKVDLRPYYELHQVDTFLFRFQPTYGLYPMSLSWPRNFRPFARALKMMDMFGGVSVCVNMLETTNVTITNASINQLLIIKTGTVGLEYNWLTVTPTSATIFPDSNLLVTLTVRNRRLDQGTYRGYVMIESNDLERESIKIKVTVDVIAQFDDKIELLPTEFRLYQNYPNPFNPRTVFRFDIPTRSRVTVEVYNLLGQKVATIVNTDKIAGRHQIEWDGSRLSSGLYFYQMTSLDANGSILFRDTRKLLLVK